MTLIDVVVIGALLKVPPGGEKFALAGVVFVLSMLWLAIYERNRFWGEVCNETARTIEKSMRTDGIGHAYMRAAVSHRVALSNTEVDGSRVEFDGKTISARTEYDRARSMHISVRAIIFTPSALAFLFATLGLVIATS